MMSDASAGDAETLKNVLTDLKANCASFHRLLESLTETDLRRPSHNPGWTNGEVLAHMLFGFIIVRALGPFTRLWGLLPKKASRPFAWLLNLSTRPFNWINAIGARGQGKVFTHRRIGPFLDNTCAALVKQASAIHGKTWQRGMYYPTRWDPTNFSEFMTLEKLFHYPGAHFNYHLQQLNFTVPTAGK